MSDSPLVSIVTPSFNQGVFLADTIRSVLEQSYPRVEYLVVDGGSTDGSVDVIKQHADRLAYWESAPDRGQAHAINKGLRRATGAILGWLNSDDVLLPDTVTRVVDVFTREPEVDVVYGRLERIDAQGRPVPTPKLPKDRQDFTPETAIGECIVNQPGSFWRRSIMDKVGYLNEEMNFALDYEYWVRMSRAGACFRRLAAPVALFRLSADSKTVGQTARAAQEHIALLERLADDPALPGDLGLSPAEVNRRVRQGVALQSLYVARGLFKDPGTWAAAAPWLWRAARNHPPTLFSSRWFKLAWARHRRAA